MRRAKYITAYLVANVLLALASGMIEHHHPSMLRMAALIHGCLTTLIFFALLDAWKSKASP